MDHACWVYVGLYIYIFMLVDFKSQLVVHTQIKAGEIKTWRPVLQPAD